MYLHVDLNTFSVSQEGLEVRRIPDNGRVLYTSAGLSIGGVKELRGAEYGHAIEVDAAARTIKFGRDYLGHFPLIYATAGNCFCISNDMGHVVKVLRGAGIKPRLAAEALALYFTMGYIPNALTVYREISMCEGQSIYQWRNGTVSRESLFEPVEVRKDRGLADLEAAIEEDVRKWAAANPVIDVWCSGGLDSSIMAQRFNDDGRKASLLTLGYGEQIHTRYGDGERSFAYEVALACNAPIRDVTLDSPGFEAAHAAFVATHHMPVIDTCVPAKYALAGASRKFVITGEGSDPLFAGPKNNLMLYARLRNPALPLGWLYAIAHGRFATKLDEIFEDGNELSRFVTDYLGSLFDRYPGDLLRKLFYLNIHVKAASLIFTESYYACGSGRIPARHPYSALNVYRTAFELEDQHKYRYPKDKLALKAIYGDRIPASITNRRKSGTMIPLIHYLNDMAPGRGDLSALRESGLFKEDLLDRMSVLSACESSPLMVHALYTLNEWLTDKGGKSHADTLSTASGRHEQRRAGAVV
jgi:asparagine synthetase B (glutamine-hydrolysing)